MKNEKKLYKTILINDGLEVERRYFHDPSALRKYVDKATSCKMPEGYELVILANDEILDIYS